jgi:FMN-dependent NADH-azoreductase
LNKGIRRVNHFANFAQGNLKGQAISNLSEIGSKRDHATPWLKTFLAFIGIQDVRFAPAVAETQKS